jgi:KamA family protein
MCGEENRMNWQAELQKSISTLGQLKKHVHLSPAVEKQLAQVIERHPMRITPYYASLINWSDPDDPIMRMAVPNTAETDLSGSYDTSGEAQSTKMPGLQHKYSETALILATSRCPMYCRYCFRKRLVGLPTEEVLRRFADAARYIEVNEEITNVLITGGDPLLLSTAVLDKMLKRLSAIPHLEFIRIGSRSPVTFPVRITSDDELVRMLGTYTRADKRLYVVTQYNHPAETTRESIRAVARLMKAGLRFINQTVLLRGVNDNARTLAELQAKLTARGIHPYYVFQCRPVKRVKRFFQIPLEEGYRIVEAAKSVLPGPSKVFRYVMSHRTGKVEVLAIIGDEIYFKYHQARDRRNLGGSFKCKLKPGAAWLDDLERPVQLVSPAAVDPNRSGRRPGRSVDNESSGRL